MIKEVIRPNHCIRVCDECGNEKKVSYWGVKNKETHLCASCSNKKSFEAKREGYKPWNIGKTYQKCSGNSYINQYGYRLYYIGDKSYKGGYVSEHRIVMELHLGRRLKIGEVIHHIDGNKLNNNISNLLLTNKKDHKGLHHSIERIAFKLFQAGFIEFVNGEYKLTNLTELPKLDSSYSILGESTEDVINNINNWSKLK